MNNTLRNAFLLALLPGLFAACSKPAEEGANASAQRYLDAWRAIHYPDATEKNGIYIIEDIPGTGSLWNEDLSVTLGTYTVRSLDGTVSYTCDEQWARQLGEWDQTYYFGPQVLMTGKDISYAGVDEILKGMRAGGTRTAIIPSWLMTYSRYDKLSDYLNVETGISPAIYTIHFEAQTADYPDYEFARMKEYALRTWGITDTLSTAAVFFKSHTEFDGEPVGMPTDTTVYINYTGRRLDGQVFDTTIADTAKFYHIYNSAKTYAPVSISFSEDVTEIKMDGVTVNAGFQYGMAAMHADEKASFLYGSSLGYGSSAQGRLIPAYCPLRFDIELVEKP